MWARWSRGEKWISQAAYDEMVIEALTHTAHG